MAEIHLAVAEIHFWLAEIHFSVAEIHFWLAEIPACIEANKNQKTMVQQKEDTP